MRCVRLSAAISLDGYIAGPNGEIDWIPMDPEIDFGELMGSFDTVLFGRKSYEAARATGGMPGMRSIVFSRSLRHVDDPDVTVSDDVAGTVSSLKRSSGKDIWLFGGGELFRSMLQLGLVDQVQIAVTPVLLGGGVPLLPQSASRSPLRLTSERLYPTSGTVLLDYVVA